MNDTKITYNLLKCNIENIEEVKIAFTNYINQYLKAFLDINLNDIVISDNIHEDVINFQKKYNIIPEISKDCRGKFITYFDDNNKDKSIIFYDYIVLYAISDINNRTLYKSVIIHELFHAQEKYITSHIYDIHFFDDNIYLKNLHNLEYNLKRICIIAWEEYFAISKTAHCLNFYETDLSNINEWLNNINISIRNIIKRIYTYNIDDNIEKYNFFNRLLEDTSQIFISICYICGNVNDFNDDNSDMVKTIKKNKIFKFLIPFNNEMQRLIEIYPDWNGTDEYNNLQNIIIKFWDYYGINIKQNKKDLDILLQRI